ncbi:16S rRNA (guanine(527)-N(7))-methyltransferase RsmG [Bacillus taeanensis]|uniref:Ribosomal RNA small subunit methyltransferase G n=1 Tax=Bacillus taeanensis TaxID=273032 RepID=A0A366XYB5_9BACI|nr:16S rRNA (guanine(527)-N(7))-methyltransferase RsmG [Bacillus taeanensis]RBW69143.1 16S rRNA (guanine(527)-N(7))-methyltransferase RsmG [Bacillus taeanensis]
MNEQQFQDQLLEKGISLSQEQCEQFSLYFKILVEWNEKMNLTAITEKEEVYEKHFFDSVTASFTYDFSNVQTVCDVGAGAGFPSIPLKICFPHLHVTIVDSLKKRIGFLQYLVDKLNLENVNLYHDRAETFGQKPEIRESYDLVTARAVARLSVLSELCLPLVKTGGTFIAMKGPQLNEELKEAEKALRILGGTFQLLEKTELPIEKSERNIVIIKKEKRTPKKYPRKPGTPNKQPL